MSCVCVCMCCPSNVGLHLFWETKFCYVRMWTWRDMYTYIHIWYKHSIANTGTIGNNWMEHQVNLCTIRNCDSLWFQLPANHSRGWHDIEISKIDQEWFQRQLLDGPYPQFRSISIYFDYICQWYNRGGPIHIYKYIVLIVSTQGLL